MRLFLVYMAIAAAYVGLALYLGRDTPWDFFAYHGYSAHSLFHDRFDLDYFGAGLQGYLNPIGFAPFALLQLVAPNSLAIGVGLALVHSLNALFVLLIARQLASEGQDALVLPAALLGAMSPVLLAHLGSTFTDPVGSMAVLAAVWLMCSKKSVAAFFCMGFLSAVAIAVKLSNAVFVIAIVVASALLREGGARAWFARMSAQTLGGVSGLLVFQGYWSYQLYKHMGSPLFPFFNGIFKSPYHPENAPLLGRFVPQSWVDFLLLPVELAKYSSWSTMEIPAPSLVPLTAALALCIYLLHLAFRARRGFDLSPEHGGLPRLVMFVVISYALWAATSGNARYAIPLFVAMGPATIFMAAKVIPKRYSILLAWLLVTLQFAMTWEAGIKRWRSQQWTQEWVSVQVPGSIRSEPFLFILLARQSHTHLVSEVHPQSAFVILMNGQFSIPSEGFASQRLYGLIRRYQGRTKVITQAQSMLDAEVPLSQVVSRADDSLDRIGLRVKDKTCEIVIVNGERGLELAINAHLPEPRSESLYVCDAEQAVPRFADERRLAEKIMAAYEARCGHVFAPAAPQIEKVDDIWLRMYSKYDSAYLMVSFKEDFISYGLTGQYKPIVIGSPKSWRDDVKRFTCSMPYQGLRGFKGFEAELKRNRG